MRAINVIAATAAILSTAVTAQQPGAPRASRDDSEARFLASPRWDSGSSVVGPAR
jgi:hypothetical protein